MDKESYKGGRLLSVGLNSRVGKVVMRDSFDIRGCTNFRPGRLRGDDADGWTWLQLMCCAT